MKKFTEKIFSLFSQDPDFCRSLRLAAAVLAVIFILFLIRLWKQTRDEHLKEKQKIAEAERKQTDTILEEYDASKKDAFKAEIFNRLQTEQLRNRDILKKQMLREVLYQQSRQFEKLKRQVLIKIIRKVLSEFRSRFFKNLQRALIAKIEKKKGAKGRLSRMQREAIREVRKKIEEFDDQRTKQDERRQFLAKQKEAEKRQEENARNEAEKEKQQQEKQERQRQERQQETSAKQQAAAQAAVSTGRGGGR